MNKINTYIILVLLALLQVVSLSAVRAEDPLFHYGYESNLASPNPGEVLINEFLSKPADGQQEWIELYNNSNNPYSLSECSIEDTKSSIHTFSNMRIDAQQFIIISLNRSRLNNGGDSITVLCNGTEIDQISYGESSSEELSSAPEAKSLGRFPDAGENWVVFHDPTPEEPNTVTNNSPQARITIQGDGKTSACQELSLNVTGEDSYDVDGDELQFSWEYRSQETQEVLHSDDRKNPLAFTFSKEMGKQFVVELLIQDPFTKADADSVVVSLDDCPSAAQISGTNTDQEQTEQSSPQSEQEKSEQTPVPSATPLQISKVLPNPKGKDRDQEWIELFNPSNSSASLKGLYLDNREGGSSAYAFLEGTVLSPLESKTFFSSQTGITLRNSGDQVRLMNSEGMIFDQVEWKESAPEGYIFSRAQLINDLNFSADEALVLDVIDGDTIEVQIQSGESTQETVRLIGIDAPETIHPHKEPEFFGKEAFQFIQQQLQGQTVRLEYDNMKRDSFGRLLAYVWKNEQHVNAQLLAQGYARAYLNYSFRLADEFKQLEQQAQAAGLGMWATQSGESSQSTSPNNQEVQEGSTTEHWHNIKLHKILPNPEGNDNEGGELIEIINRGRQTVSLEGWKILNSKGKPLYSFSAQENIAGQEILSITPKSALKNSSENLQLVDPQQQVRDEFSYQQSIKSDQLWLKNWQTNTWQLITPDEKKTAEQNQSSTRKTLSKKNNKKPLYLIAEQEQEGHQAQEDLPPQQRSGEGFIPRAAASEASQEQQTQEPLWIFAVLVMLLLVGLWQIHSSLRPRIAAQDSPQ